MTKEMRWLLPCRLLAFPCVPELFTVLSFLNLAIFPRAGELFYIGYDVPRCKVGLSE